LQFEVQIDLNMNAPNICHTMKAQHIKNLVLIIFMLREKKSGEMISHYVFLVMTESSSLN